MRDHTTQPPSDEEVRRMESEYKEFQDLENTHYTLDQLLDMAESNPQYKPLLKKALTLASASIGFNHKIIATWPDAIKSNWGDGVDAIASLDQRVQEEGIEVLREFGSTKLSASAVIKSVESVLSSFAMQMGLPVPDLRKQISNLLLNKE